MPCLILEGKSLETGKGIVFLLGWGQRVCYNLFNADYLRGCWRSVCGGVSVALVYSSNVVCM